MRSVYDYSIEDWQRYVEEHGQKSYRVKQLFSWLYQKRVNTFDEMSDLPADFIESLKNDFSFETVTEVQKQVSKDGTVKYLFSLADGAHIETVLMSFNFGKSVCVSSQVGCNMGCTFCASGLLKKQRDLTSGEIVAQIMHVQKELDEMGERVGNIVVMGCGEPFDNYDNVLRFCSIVNSDIGLAIGARHLTICEFIYVGEQEDRHFGKNQIGVDC